MWVWGLAFAAVVYAGDAKQKQDDRIFNLPLGQPAFVAEITPDIEASYGVQAGFGSATTFRWTMRLELAGGRVETRDFVISSDALIQFQQNDTRVYDNFALRMLTVGETEFLVKQNGFALAFEGITVGTDRDRGYSDIFSTGIAMVFNLVKTARDQLQFRSGYRYQQLEVNGVLEQERHLLPQAISYRWQNGGRWSANIDIGVALDAARPLSDASEVRLFGAAGVHADMLRLKHFILGWGTQLSYERDPWRNQFGLTPDTAILGMSFDVRLDPGTLRIERRK